MLADCYATNGAENTWRERWCIMTRPVLSEQDKERAARVIGAVAICFVTEPYIWGRFVKYMNDEFADTSATELVNAGARGRHVCMLLSVVLGESLPGEDEMTTEQEDYDQGKPTTL